MGAVIWVLVAVGLVALCLAGWVAWLVWDEECYRSRRRSWRPGVSVRPVPGSAEAERAVVMRRAVEVKRQQDAAALQAALAMLAVARSFHDDRP